MPRHAARALPATSPLSYNPECPVLAVKRCSASASGSAGMSKKRRPCASPAGAAGARRQCRDEQEATSQEPRARLESEPWQE